MRLIVPSDTHNIVEMLRVLREESPAYNYVEDDPVWVAGNLEPLLERDAIVGVIEPERGFMIGAVYNTWYSKRIEAAEQLLYVHPDHRGGLLAVRLIKAFEALARSAGATYLHVGATTDMAEDRTRELYMRLGYEPKGQSLRKKLNV